MILAMIEQHIDIEIEGATPVDVEPGTPNQRATDPPPPRA